MKISVNWLKEFIPSLSSDSSGLVDHLTFLGLEVEEVFEQKLPDEKVVAGKIAEVRPHPNAAWSIPAKASFGRSSAVRQTSRLA
jgi:phenylalanyl-tRNA synthetase beta chain